MALPKQHRILIATDGSPSANAAIAVAMRMPWYPSARVLGVVGRPDWVVLAPAGVAAVISRETADAARKRLVACWPDAQVTEVDKPPVEAILDEARRHESSVIVLGWRGHGALERFLAGSVSRAVAARAPCAVLVARSAPQAIRRLVIGYDGSTNSDRAIDFVCSLEPRSDIEAIVVDVMEPSHMPPSATVLPESVRAQVHAAIDDLNLKTEQEARALVSAAVEKLKRHGLHARAEICKGTPLAALLNAANSEHADILILGARAVSGVERALLGSVANGALNRAPMPVLLVR